MTQAPLLAVMQGEYAIPSAIARWGNSPYAWAGAGSKMRFDIRDLDQFVEISKESDIR